MNSVAIRKSLALRGRSNLRVVSLLGFMLTAFLLTNLHLAPAMAQDAFTIGGDYPAAITIESSGLPGERSSIVEPHTCYGSGSGQAPLVQTGFAEASASPYYNRYVQTVWYRVWVQRWNGSTWVYYNGGRTWQKKILPAYATGRAFFFGENVPVAAGSWYRVAEEFIYEVNGARVGRALNVFNRYAYQKAGNVLFWTTPNGQSACGIL